MRKVIRTMGLFIAFAIIALLGLITYVRLAPTTAADWHNSLPPIATLGANAAVDQVIPLTGGAALHLSAEKGAPAVLLGKLHTIAMATPRTTHLAGSLEEGRITWVTRSALWGFPDYTTAEVRPDGLYLYARLRFGREDFGVNAKRLSDWLSRL